VLFDPDTGETRAMRTKEDAADYRYFPDPDLPPLVIAQSWMDGVRASMAELPRVMAGSGFVVRASACRNTTRPPDTKQGDGAVLPRSRGQGLAGKPSW
jgi:hypothetical protein